MLVNQEPVTVSIVEDDKAVRESLTRLVESVGYSAESYPTAEEFLQEGALTQPDCLIVDVRLPGMDGIELLDRLAIRGFQRPSVVITGHAYDEALRHSPNQKEVWYFPKPYDPEKLLSVIAGTVAR